MRTLEVRGKHSPLRGTKPYAQCLILKSLAFNAPSSKYDLAKNTGLSWAYVHRLIIELRKSKLVKRLRRIPGPRPVNPYCTTAQGLYVVFLLDQDVSENWAEVLRRNRSHLEPEQVDLLELSVPPIPILSRNPLTVEHYEQAIIDTLAVPEFFTDEALERIALRVREKPALKKRILDVLSPEIDRSKTRLKKMETLVERLS